MQTRLPAPRDLAPSPDRSRRGGQCLLILAAALALSACGRQPPLEAAQIPHTPIPKVEAVLRVANEAGTLRYRGSVADAATRDALVAAIARASDGQAKGELLLEPDTNPPPWASGLGEALASLRTPGTALDFRDRRIALDGPATDEERANLLKALRRIYPGYTFAGRFDGVDMRQALPDPGDTEALLALLNSLPIRFEDDSGMVTRASLDGLARGARALRAAGRDVRIEAGVFTEDGESADNDLQVAAQRADAVRLQLAVRGANPLAIQPRVLPASRDRGGQVEFRLLAPVAATRAVTAAARDVTASPAAASPARTATTGLPARD